MARSLRLLLFMTLILSIACAVVAGIVENGLVTSFTVLHVFLFNLTCGGLLIVTYLWNRRDLALEGATFYVACLVFSFAAAFGSFLLAVVSALILSAMVEFTRWRKFSFFPLDFFKKRPTSEKFEQASLLCLSIGLFICALAMLNNHYLEFFQLEKLDLHVFFLGFSFPISLMNFSFLFRGIEKSGRAYSRALSEFCFWGLNIGVIFFFFFIIFKAYPYQLLMALVLFATVIVVTYYHVKKSERNFQWSLLLSSLCFLVLGSLTGIAYILVLWLFPHYPSGYVLSLHSAATLFGWNLTWIILAVRAEEPPPAIRARYVIIVHWVFVLLLPAARESVIFGLAALVPYFLLLTTMFFLKGKPATPERL
ncbi:MAG: hypothetical protein R6V10_09395 [bacterium]